MIRSAFQSNERPNAFDFFVPAQKSNLPVVGKAPRLLRRVPYIGALAFGFFISPCCGLAPFSWAQTPLVDSVPQGATNVNVPVASPSTLQESREQEIEATRFSSGLYGDPAPNSPPPFPQTPTAIPPFFPASAADATPTAARARLETLAWAIGCWELESNGFVFQTKIDWAPGGSYLLCRDYVRPAAALAEPVGSATPTPNSTFSALRVIAWNPVAGLFQSSIFCRDGSYGSGLWQREGDGWRVATRILLVDGRAATSVEYFTPSREGGFVWESTQRTVENTPLPNVGPAQTRSLSLQDFERIENSTFNASDALEAPATKSEFE